MPLAAAYFQFYVAIIGCDYLNPNARRGLAQETFSDARVALFYPGHPRSAATQQICLFRRVRVSPTVPHPLAEAVRLATASLLSSDFAQRPRPTTPLPAERTVVYPSERALRTRGSKRTQAGCQ